MDVDFSLSGLHFSTISIKPLKYVFTISLEEGLRADRQRMK